MGTASDASDVRASPKSTADDARWDAGADIPGSEMVRHIGQSAGLVRRPQFLYTVASIMPEILH